jgi:hypothetical protein
MGFKDLKKQSTKGGTIASLQEKLKSLNTSDSTSYKDDRFWYPARDTATKKGSAVIRFLPAREEDVTVDDDGTKTSVNGFPWVRTYSHSYQNENNGKWYIEDCPTTIGENCPMCEANSDLWNTGSEANQNLVRKRKRRLQYIANVLVVSDPANPENEGKVFLYKFGKKIYDKIQAVITPEFDDEEAVDVFDMWNGANFALRIGVKDGWTNYDKSEFLTPSAISDDDTELEEIYNSMYNLSEFIAPSRFKSYDELKKRLDLVLGNTTATPPAREQAAAEKSYEDDGDYDAVDESAVDDSQSAFFSALADD